MDSLEIKEDVVNYFILSIAWRYMQYRLEQNLNKIPENIVGILRTMPPYDVILEEEIIEKWRILLYSEKLDEINKIAIYLIPLEKIGILSKKSINDFMFSMPTGLDLLRFVNYEYVYIKIPKLMFLCTYKGTSNSLIAFQVGNKVNLSIEKNSFPSEILDIINKNIEGVSKIIR